MVGIRHAHESVGIATQRKLALFSEIYYDSSMETEAKTTTSWTIKRLLEWTTEHFTQTRADQPRLCAELLLADVLGCQRIDLYVKFDHCPDEERLGRFREYVKRCAAHEPVGYILGKAHFFSLELEVSPAVLIPRPETEVLVAGAIDYCRHETNRPTVDVLDLCTGSGCIAIALATHVVETEIIALDRSGPALEVARKNIEKHELSGRITLLESDLFDKIDDASKAIFDLIVANPPYISTAEYENLPVNVRDYEPAEALRAGADGLDVHRRIINQAQLYLPDNGAIMLEIAYDQAQEVIALCQDCGYLTDISTVRDNQGHKRVVRARKK
jgi:release factor glutamine methyltransferase